MTFLRRLGTTSGYLAESDDSMKSWQLLVGMALIVLSALSAYSDTFKVSDVSWVGDSLRIEVQTDRPDGAELNAQLTRDKTGEHTVSMIKFGTVSGGRFVVDADINDEDKPLRAGRYWLTIANGYDFLPLAAVLPISIPTHKQSAAGRKKKEPQNNNELRVDQAEGEQSRPTSTPAPEMKEADLLADPVLSGQVRMLRGLGKGAETVLVCADKEAVEQRDKAFLANDEAGVEELAMARRLMIVKPGTKVKVLDLHGFLTPVVEIRILEGPHEGRRGFVLISELAAR
jgi:hypothetical protein